MTVQDYINKLNTRYKQGNSTEHSFRGDLQNLLETLLPAISVTNEPTREKCGAPDYILTKGVIPVGYIEAKDLGADVNSKNYKEQFTRYKAALQNLIITNYLDFEVYKDGVLVATHSIGSLSDGKVTGKPDRYDAFTAMIKDFSNHVGQTIRSAQKLAVMMANKAKVLADVIGNALESDEDTTANSTLQEQYKAFQDILIHDITAKGFADIYAQTIAYGMFAARLHDTTLDSFSRHEAAELIPKSNPFLRKLFQYIAGYDLDTRIVWIVDALADIFRATDVKGLLKNFGKATKQHDPIIHFYETFLSEYDPKLRKSRGVWYTPEPVVNFIVRAVDYILKTEFGLTDGLADTSKVKIRRTILSKTTADQRSKLKEVEIEEEVHRVQILDPATGTGTFLAEVIRQIHEKFEGQKGIWSSYVEKHLIPRLNGFELLMASYAMAHLKLDMLLTETGYKPKTNQRLRVYLTNSLEEHHPDTGTLFANWLSSEANEANHIKRDVPVMVVLGNPPYNINSWNKNTWVENLLNVYKDGLDEQNMNALSDDYVKFLRYSQHFIERTGSGIIAMITNNSFIDGVTQRKMRESLLKSFDCLYVFDLHGSYYRKEKALDGSKDENVFDILQGVSICLMIKKTRTENHCQVNHFESFGKRQKKYDELARYNINDIKWTTVLPQPPYYYFVPKDINANSEYLQFFKLDTLFIHSGNGIKFRKDNLLVKNMFSRSDVITMLNDINSLDEGGVYRKYDFEPTADWNIRDKKAYFIKDDVSNIISIDYRQFDRRFTYYPIQTINEIIVRGDSRRRLMQNYLQGENLGLVIGRQGQVVGDMPWNLAFICNNPTDMNIFYRGGGINFPLYIYSGDEMFNNRTPNFEQKLLSRFEAGLELKFTDEKQKSTRTFSPIDVLDYIYAVLHSPTYREKYKEFLKIDFPRVPFPTNKETFWQLVRLGAELRQINLLESSAVRKFITQYPVDGSNIVEKPVYKDGKVWINSEQYFKGVPEVAWNFYIGGYQPAQKWLKDRKGRELSIEDVQHYQKVIVALTETDRLMKEIDKIDFITA